MDNSRNTMLAIALSIAVILAWQFLYVSPKIEAERQQAQQQQQRAEQTLPAESPQADSGQAQTGGQDIPTPDGTGTARAPGASADLPVSQALSRDAALARSDRVAVENSHIIGSINLKGARVDDLRLKDYRISVDENSPLVTLLSPAELERGYFAEFGFVASGSSGNVPGPETVWEIAGNDLRLTPSNPITLRWTNDRQVSFVREIAIDDEYMFTISDRIENGSGNDITLSPYGRVTRFSMPETQSVFVLHEGMIGVLGEYGLEEISYSSLQDDREFTIERADGGWLGITDKYWAATLVPEGEYKPRFSYFDDGRIRFQSDFLGDPISVAAGSSHSMNQLLFAGAKEVDLIDQYEAEHNILKFDKLIDWGLLYFFTKPTFFLLDWLYRLVGNFGVAILIGTVLIKAALYPLANMSYKSMARMKKLQPEMTAMRERFGDDKIKLQQEMMALYKKQKVNPAAGCWPVLVQIPIFFALYKVLYVTIEMRHAPFFGWINDLAAPDPTSLFNLFGLLPYTPPDFLLLGVWPLIMGVTMFLQMQMNPTPPDPTQAMIFKWMPVVFTFMLASFPAGLVIYWAWNNTLSIIQQGLIMKQQGVKIELWDNLRSLFRRKTKPAE
jgi:YidC/Oxa1 family membrane protein insertase